MAINVTDWLHSLGLEHYAEAFRNNDIDGEVLPEVNADDLIAIGVTSIGHRRKLLAAIATLKPADPVPTLSSISAVRSADAERRQLTVMFCDLVGSTALSAQLDPEELSNVIGAFQKACASAVSVFGGSIAKYMGDGALVYFGYPEAHEDDAERAVRAGLALLDAMAAIHLPMPVRPQVRIGIATGLVVVGELIGDGSCSGTCRGRRDIEPGCEDPVRSISQLSGSRGIDVPSCRCRVRIRGPWAPRIQGHFRCR